MEYFTWPWEDVGEELRKVVNATVNAIEELLQPIFSLLNWIKLQINQIQTTIGNIVDSIANLPETILDTLMKGPEWVIEKTADAFIYLFDFIKEDIIFAQRDMVVDSLEGTFLAGFVAPVWIAIIVAEVVVIIYVMIAIYDRIPFVG